MEGEFDLSWSRKFDIHENALTVAAAKLYEAQQEKATWATVANATKAGSPENNAAKQQVQTHGLTILYCQKAIELHARKLAELEKTRPAEDTDEGETVDEPAIVPFPGSADRAAGELG